MQPVVFGLAGASLLADEARFFRETDPLGFILFARNCIDKAQISALTSDLREAVGRADAPVLIDQEGGRVARLKPPIWPAYRAAKVFGDLALTDLDAALEAVRLNAALIGTDLRELGITVDCAPLVDVPVEGAHQMIGDRAYGSDPGLVARLGRAACDGFLASNVLPVVKHLPGYGRARVDSHESLPVIEEPVDVLDTTDFEPFRSFAGVAWGMTAHALYTAIDPERAATVSALVVRDIIRGRIGFKGILITDDICMEALQGTPPERATASLAAGCDIVLHCNGKVEDMRAIAEVMPTMSSALVAKVAAAEVTRVTGGVIDIADARERLASLLAAA